MRSLRNIGQQDAALPLLADDVVEFHASRLLLLLKLCGIKGRIDSLTKMAKLDFFVRYPTFFAAACKALGISVEATEGPTDAAMVRYHYGPWDQRYYHVLAFLESRGLIEVVPNGKGYCLSLTPGGQTVADDFEQTSDFAGLCAQMRSVKKAFGTKTGSRLKEVVYDVFDKEVAQLPLGKVIHE